MSVVFSNFAPSRNSRIFRRRFPPDYMNSLPTKTKLNFKFFRKIIFKRQKKKYCDVARIVTQAALKCDSASFSLYLFSFASQCRSTIKKGIVICSFWSSIDIDILLAERQKQSALNKKKRLEYSYVKVIKFIWIYRQNFTEKSGAT